MSNKRTITVTRSVRVRTELRVDTDMLSPLAREALAELRLAFDGAADTDDMDDTYDIAVEALEVGDVVSENIYDADDGDYLVELEG